MITSRKATIEDIESFAHMMRQDDIDEIWALVRRPGFEMLTASFYASRECMVGELDGTLFCIFGCVPTDDGGANMWMLFANHVECLPMSFFRKSKEQLGLLLQSYRYLTNYVSVDNVFLIKWIKWLGFELSPVQPYGMDGIPCHFFRIGRDGTCV